MKTIKSYQQALEYLGSKKERPYAHNTRIERDPLNLGHEAIIVKYHGNSVVTFFPDRVSFSSCGWKTLTTKERINWFLPEGFRLYQERSVWYVVGKGKVYPWEDGITIKGGEVYNYGELSSQESTKKLVKAIKRYVDGYIKALIDGQMEAPSGADCWHCLLVTADGTSLGEISHSDHIQSHIDESYYVPSLIMRAYEFNNRLSDLSKDGIARCWNHETISDWQKDIVSRDVRSCLTSYLKHCLGIAA